MFEKIKRIKEPIKIGISRCLLGHKVRYDGEHSCQPFLTEEFGKIFEYVPVCPEVECGMPIPRETIRLVGAACNPRVITSHTNIDKTQMIQNWISEKLKCFETQNLKGFIFKSRSPSCGLYNVKLYKENTARSIRN